MLLCALLHPFRCTNTRAQKALIWSEKAKRALSTEEILSLSPLYVCTVPFMYTVRQIQELRGFSRLNWGVRLRRNFQLAHLHYSTQRSVCLTNQKFVIA